MWWSRRGALALLLLTAVLNVPGGQAQADPSEFLLLGVDGTGDGRIAGQAPSLDTWVDINSLSVATRGTDLVFHLGLEGTTTEIGSYCWMAAFQVGSTEYVGLDCYEGVAYESDNTLSSVSRPSTSRGTNVASSVVFDATGAVITIPLSAIGVGVGDVIDDIYGLTYVTRALNVVDVIPNAKSAAGAAESLGSYRIGGPATETVAEPIRETLVAPTFAHNFTNITTATYLFDANVSWPDVEVVVTAAVQAGSANITVRNGNATVLQTLLTNATSVDNQTIQPASNATGAWTIEVRYEQFLGTLNVTVREPAPALGTPTGGNATGSASATSSPSTSTTQTSASSSEDKVATPGAPLAFVLVALLALARRRRSP